MDNVVVLNENRIHDSILTSMVNSVMLEVEFGIRSTNVSSGRGPDSEENYHGQRDFSGESELISATTASSL